MLKFAAPLLLAGLALGCDNAGEGLGLPALPEGTIGVGLFFDRDGSQTQTAGDTVFAGARVSLLVAGGTDTIRTVTSGADGVALFENVPVGRYRVVVDRAALADSGGVVVGDPGTVRILASSGNTTGGRVVRLGSREVSIAEARMLAPGARVYVRGVIHTPLQVFRDSSSFMSSAGNSIRITGARHRPGRTGNNPGDSVLVLGTSGVRDGQPVIIDGLIGTLGIVSAPLPTSVTVAEVRTARGGTLDAAFVTLAGAVIADTSTAGVDFIVRISDAATPSITAEVVIDANLLGPRTVFKPTLPISVRGVLVPKGDGTWVLKPRGGSDVTIG